MIAGLNRRALVLALIIGAGLTPFAAAGQTDSLEFPIKAQFLYKFAPFIEWPAAAFETPGSPLTICILGRDPFAGGLDRAVAGQHVGGRPFAVKRLTRLDTASGCHLAYISATAEQTVASALQAARGAFVLTVTDEAVAAAPRGMLHFVIRDRRVRFIADPAAATAAGLTISSKLLALSTPP